MNTMRGVGVLALSIAVAPRTAADSANLTADTYIAGGNSKGSLSSVVVGSISAAKAKRTEGNLGGPLAVGLVRFDLSAIPAGTSVQ